MQFLHTCQSRVVARFSGALLALAISGCSTTAVDARLAYWRAEVAANLPVGATEHQAEKFFAERGAELKCCVSTPSDPALHFVLERHVGHGLLMEYDVAVLVKFSAAEQVESVSVQRWGIGL